MFFHHFKKCSVPCLLSKWIVAVLLLLTSLASLFGVYQTHMVSDGIQFGGSAGSLAIIAFVVSVMAWSKQMICCMKSTCEVCDS